jgi:glycosyltransferase involved in cell wall biosynthesis
VLFAGADLADRRKGGSLLVDAMSRLERDVRLVVAGEAAVPGLDATALGLLDEDGMADAYAAADVYVLPTRADNLPNTAIESMACGTPVVAFSIGGVPEVVRHLETGYLAPPEDAGALAVGLQTLLDDDELRARLGANARAVAQAEFGIEQQARHLADLYGSVLA